MAPTKKIGILGYGKLGQFLVEKIRTEGKQLGLELTFLWNRSPIDHLDSRIPILKDLESELSTLEAGSIDLIVEVCHPNVITSFGVGLLAVSNLLVGSSTALAEEEVCERLRKAAVEAGHRLLIARGALWGANDIQRMARQGLLEKVKVTMVFHPKSLRLPADSQLKKVNDVLLRSDESSKNPVVLYEGPVRAVCNLAPNNVNTMATAALLGVGLDRTIGVLISDPSVTDHHRITVEVTGVRKSGTTRPFSVESTRVSPTSTETSVSSTQTFDAFWQSVLDSLGMLDSDNSQIHVS